MTDTPNPTPTPPTPGAAGAGTPPPTPATPPTQLPVSELSKPTPLKTTPPPPQNVIIPPAAVPGQPAQAHPATGTTPQVDAEVTTTDVDESSEPPLWRKIVSFLVSWILIPAALVYLVHNFIFQAWYVDGQSMEPTFQNGNYLIVSKFEVSWKKFTGQSSNLNIQRGDVAIFNPPNFPDNVFFIKRAIGLPGDRVVIKDGTVTIYNKENPNGTLVNESYVGGIALEGDVDTQVADGEIFVLGDNRNPNASQDSRYFGPIPMKRFIGTAALRLLPVYEFGQVENPDYGPSLEK